jgi:hypothetical protein
LGLAWQIWLFLQRLFRPSRPLCSAVFTRRPKACALETLLADIRIRRKPDWLRLEVLRFKAHMPRAGCRTVPYTFNRLHPGVSVGKTFVADLIASHQLEIAQLRRQIRTARARTVAVNNTWAMDMPPALTG